MGGIGGDPDRPKPVKPGLGLRRVLTSALVLIIFVSLLLSALGVAVLVRGYLWNREAREAESVAKSVARLLEFRQGRANERGPVTRRNRRPLGRNLQRLNRGANHILLLKNRELLPAEEEEDNEWAGLAQHVRPGLREVTFNGEKWQVFAIATKSDTADMVAVVRPWSPSLRLVRALVLYQTLVSALVMGLAFAVGSFFSKRLALPLEELRDKTKDVGQHSVEKLEASQVLEITQLQQSFLEMSRRVTETMASQRRFVADASHELKTPLTAITGMLELLQSHPDMEPDDRVQALSVAKKEADRMGSLVADLLLLSRAQAKHSGAKSNTNLAELLAEQIETLQLLFPNQVFEVQGSIGAEIEINPQAFSRIARNLMENAARYGGGAPVTVTLKEEKQSVKLSIKDSGPGIPTEKQAHLFERFYRTDSGRARSEGGHGLGLAIVKALVEEAGGRIRCESKPGEGAEFQLEFFRKP